MPAPTKSCQPTRRVVTGELHVGDVLEHSPGEFAPIIRIRKCFNGCCRLIEWGDGDGEFGFGRDDQPVNVLVSGRC